jgi:hypothetical protein
MKHSIDAPAEPAMQCFTSEAFRRITSAGR